MRIHLMKKAAGYVATASLIACPFVSSVTMAMPLQGAYTTTSTTNSESAKLPGNAALARNNTAYAESTPSTAIVKEPKQHDKKAISRCWKRLMGMVREVSHTHPNKHK